MGGYLRWWRKLREQIFPKETWTITWESGVVEKSEEAENLGNYSRSPIKEGKLSQERNQ